MSNMLRGKFRDRLRNILKKRSSGKLNNNIVLNKDTKKVDIPKIITKPSNKNTLKNRKQSFSKNKIVISKSKPKAVRLDKEVEKKELIENKKVKLNINKLEQKPQNNKNSNIENLEIKIISKVEKLINSYKNDLEIISTDIYVLSECIKDKKSKEKIEEEKKQVEDLIGKINKIKEQFNILRCKNIDAKYLEIDNLMLVDDICKYKKNIENISDISKYQDKYKKLEVFIETNFLLDNLEKDIKSLENKNIEKMMSYNINCQQLDKKKDELFYHENRISEFNLFVENQEHIIDNMSNKLGKIKSFEDVKIKFVGYDKLIFNDLKYISLLLLSPLKGIFPSIALSTLSTKKTLDLIKKDAHIDQVKTVVYIAEDYEKEISTNIYNINNMNDLIIDSLLDIKNIKETLSLNSTLKVMPEYDEFIKKINKVEDILNNNRNKLDKLKKKLNNYHEINKSKLIKVRKLNENL